MDSLKATVKAGAQRMSQLKRWLQQKDFRHSRIEGEDFSYRDLREAKLDSVVFVGCNLRGSSWSFQRERTWCYSNAT